MIPDEPEEFGSAHPERGRWFARVVLGCLVLGAVAVVALHSGRSAGHHGRPGPSPPPSRPPTVVRAGHRLLGVTAGWELFARGPVDVISIRLARGLVSTTSVPQLESGNPDVTFLIGPHEAIVRSADLVPGYLIPDGSPAQSLTGRLANFGPLIPGPDQNHAWVLSANVFHPSVLLVDLHGRATGISIRFRQGAVDLPSTAAPDGRGYLLMETSDNGVTDAGPTWDRRVAGTIVATGPTRWLTVVCNAHSNRCHNEVIDPATGGTRVLPGPAAPGVFGPYYQYYWPPLGVISPDGATAALPVAGKYVRLVDLRSGATYSVAAPLNASPSSQCLAWSPDSKWLFVAGSGGRLLAVNARSRGVQGLGVTLPYVTQVAIRNAPR